MSGGLRLRMMAANLCHPGKTDCNGEDAFAIREYDQRQIFAVADGVSGSRKFGDPADFSRSLLRYTLEHLQPDRTVPEAVDLALRRLRDDGHKGSTTLLLGVLEIGERSIAKVYNLGDSQAMLFRPQDGTGHYELVEQTAQQMENKGTGQTPFQFHHCVDHSRSVSDICLYQWALKPGDVILAGTDGLFEFFEIEDLVAALHKYHHDLPHLPHYLVDQARINQRSADHYDDISVIVALAADESSGKWQGQNQAMDNFVSLP